MKKKPIDEVFRIARDILWNPRLQRKRMLSDLVTPPDCKPSSKPRVRTFSEIVALVQEMVDEWGDCPAVEAYQRKLFEESGFSIPPRKMTDAEWDELLGEGE